MNGFTWRRLVLLTPYAAALVSLLFMAWTAWEAVQHPEAGITWSLIDGQVEQVDPHGTAAGLLEPGDRIFSVDDTPVELARLFPGRQAGETIRLLVEQEDQQQVIILQLSRPSLKRALQRLVPLVIGLVFWVTGTGTLAYSRVNRQTLLFFLFCQASSMTLAAGVLSPFGPAWVVPLFGQFVWWLGILIIHFHLYFPENTLSSTARLLAIGVYVLGGAGSLFDLSVAVFALHPNLLALHLAHRAWPVLSLIGALLLLIRAYRHTNTPQARQQIRLVTLGGLLALSPLVSFSLLPDLLLQKPFISYEVAFLFLLVIPLAYGYAILRYRLIALERSINRSASLALVLSLLGSICAVLYVLLAAWLPSDVNRQPLVGLGITLFCAALAIPLYHRLQVLVDRLFYGGWYDYRSAVREISQILDLPLDSTELAAGLCQRIQHIMQLERVCLLVKGKEEYLAVVSTLGSPHARPFHVQIGGAIGHYLGTLTQPIWAHEIPPTIQNTLLQEAECLLLACQDLLLWLPLGHSPEPFEGALMVGAKRGGEPLNGRDVEILQTVARHIGISLQNAWLIAELRQRAFESVQLHRAVLRAREEERKRVARDLHDDIIQALVGLNYHLAQTRHQLTEDMAWHLTGLQGEVRQILGEVRQICVDLRPPALDNLGLVSALRARIRQFEAQASLRLALHIEGEHNREVTEEIAVCAYRVLQEGLFNIQKHAHAERVTVKVRFTKDTLLLRIEDDGCGFTAPSHLGRLIEIGHFGLAGLRERVDAVGGTFNIQSRPGSGTRLEACLPLESAAPISHNIAFKGNE